MGRVHDDTGSSPQCSGQGRAGSSTLYVVMVCVVGVMLVASGNTRADVVTLNNGTQIHGTLELDRALGIAPEAGISFIPLARVKEVYVHGKKILFFLEEGNWLECEILTSELILNTEEGIWQVVRADTVKKIMLHPKREADIELVVLRTSPGTSEALPVVPVPTAPDRQTIPAPVEGSLPEPIRMHPLEDSALQAPKRYSLSPELGFADMLGDDSDILSGGFAYGLSFYYELFQENRWFLGPDVSFVRSTHEGKEFLDGTTQNLNPLCVGVRGGYGFDHVDLYAKMQLGAVIMDSSGRSGGRSDTVFGFQFGGGFDYTVAPWFLAGPELRFTQADGKSIWLSILGRVSLRF